MKLLETIEKIKALRREAEEVLERDPYDPCGYAAAEAKELCNEADLLEQEMERRLGWHS